MIRTRLRSRLRAGVGGGSGGPALRAISPYNAFPDNPLTTAGTRFSYVWRYPVVIGSGDTPGLVIALNNVYQFTTSVILGTSPYTVDACSLERVSVPATTPVKWSGSRTPTIPAGSGKVLSDTILPSAFGLAKFTRGETYWVKIGITLSGVGQTFAAVTPACASLTGQQALAYDKAAGTMTSVDATGTFGVGSGSPGFTGAGLYPPIIVLGTFISGDPKTILGVGDSILRGVGDTVASGPQGMFYRSLFDVDLVSNPIGGINMSKAGGFSSTWGTANVAKLLEYIPYCKYAWEEYGTNGLVQTDEPPLWAQLRANGISSIIRNYLQPRPTDTLSVSLLVGSGTTATATVPAALVTEIGTVGATRTMTVAGATPSGLNGSYTMTVATSTTVTYPNATVSAGATGTITVTDNFIGLACQTGAASQTAYNTYLSTQGGGAPGVDTLFLLTGVFDATFTDKWAVNGTANYMTADLIHPATAGHVFAAAAARTAIAALP